LSVPRWYLWEGGFLLSARARGVVPAHAHHAIQIVIALVSLLTRRQRRNWSFKECEMSMPYLVGVVLAVGVVAFGRLVGFDRDRAFYPTMVIVVAAYYVLFAAMNASLQTIVLETVVMSAFVTAAVVGFRSSTWIVVAALAGHGVFDGLHGHVIDNPGVPAWWPAFCLAFDVVAGAGLAWLAFTDAGRRAGRQLPLGVR
jgi:hypothetical protein